MGPSKVEDVVTPPEPWKNFGSLSRGWRQQPDGLTSAFFPGTFWTHGRTDIQQVGSLDSEKWLDILYGFQTCTLCHEVSHRELIANIPSLPFVLLTVFFQSSPKIHDHR